MYVCMYLCRGAAMTWTEKGEEDGHKSDVDVDVDVDAEFEFWFMTGA